MTSESQRELLSPSPRPQALGPPSALQPTAYSLKPGLSLVELLIAIGILGVAMTLIGAAFPAGVAMSIAVSDETTAQSVFQQAVGVIRDNYSVAKITNDSGAGELAPDTEYDVVKDDYLGINSSGVYDAEEGVSNRKYEFEEDKESNFSWSVLMRRMAASGPMGNLCQVVIVVSRRPSGSPNFIMDDGGGDSELPELRRVNCTASDEPARTLDINDGLVPNSGYIIDATTGTAYIIVSRDNNKVVTLGKPPSNADIGGNRDFWLVPGPYDGSNYGRKSPAIRVFQALLYLP